MAYLNNNIPAQLSDEKYNYNAVNRNAPSLVSSQTTQELKWEIVKTINDRNSKKS